MTRTPNKNGAARPRSKVRSVSWILLDLGFAEFDVLARDRVVLLLDQLVGHGARILLGDVIEAGIRRGDELDLDGDRFGHFRTSNVSGFGRRPNRPAFAGNLASDSPKSRFCRPITARFPAINPRRSGFSAAAIPDSPARYRLHTRAGKARGSAVPAPPCRRSRRALRGGTGTCC